MQRMIVLMIFENEDLSSFDEEAITYFTNRYCLENWYTELEYEEISADHFTKEANWIFKVFDDQFRGKEITELIGSPYGTLGFFKNKQPVETFEKPNPVSDEVVLKAYSLVDYNDGKCFFAISETNYILLNWQSDGPLHLLVKPAERNPDSLLISKDAFYGALGIKNEPE